MHTVESFVFCSVVGTARRALELRGVEEHLRCREVLALQLLHATLHLLASARIRVHLIDLGCVFGDFCSLSLINDSCEVLVAIIQPQVEIVISADVSELFHLDMELTCLV